MTASVLIGLSLGFRRASLARWLSIGVAVAFAFYTFGLSLLVGLFGIQ